MVLKMIGFNGLIRIASSDLTFEISKAWIQKGTYLKIWDGWKTHSVLFEERMEAVNAKIKIMEQIKQGNYHLTLSGDFIV